LQEWWQGCQTSVLELQGPLLGRWLLLGQQGHLLWQLAWWLLLGHLQLVWLLLLEHLQLALLLLLVHLQLALLLRHLLKLWHREGS
jgi:hypothetical protein